MSDAIVTPIQIEGGLAGPVRRVPVDDPALPHLEDVLSPERIALRLHESFPEFSAAIPLVAIRYVRYLRGRSCRVVCEVRQEEPRLFYLRHEAPGRTLLRDKEKDPADSTGNSPKPELADKVHLDPQRRIVLRLFPYDALLGRLERIRDFKLFRPIVEAALAEEDSKEWRVRSSGFQVSVARYKPEHRCVLRLRIKARLPEEGDRQHRNLFAHLGLPGACRSRFAVMSQLSGTEGRDGRLPVARPMYYDERRGLLLEEALMGEPLAQHLDHPKLAKVVGRLATGLADIHQSDVDPGARIGVQELIEATQIDIDVLSQAPGVDVERIREVGSRLIDQAPKTTGPEALVHGDFHHGQILVRKKRVWIVDFDRAARGDALVDIGNFVANLAVQIRSGKLPKLEAQRFRELFLEEYAKAWPEAMNAERLKWFTAIALFRFAPAPFRQLRHKWPDRVMKRVEFAHEVWNEESP